MDVDREIAALATGQHGIVTTSQLAALGLKRDVVAKRCRRGELHRLYRGVYAVGHTALSREARWFAAVAAYGPGAGLSFVAAAQLWNMTRRTSARIDVSAVTVRRPQRLVRVHYVPDCLIDLVRRQGIPVTSPARTIADLAAIMDAPELANVIHEAQYRELVTLDDLETIADRRPGRSRCLVFRTALDYARSGSSGTKSRIEDRVFAVVLAHVTPPPRLNEPIECPGRLVEADLTWLEHRLCVEVDGPGHRRLRTAREDAERTRLLRLVGFHVLRVEAETFLESPEADIRRIQRALNERCRTGDVC